MGSNEHYDTKRENINLASVISLALFDFWGHICLGAVMLSEGRDILVCAKAKVCYLDVKFLIDEDVVELEISVNRLLLVMQALDSLDNLSHKESGRIFSHSSTGLAYVEEVVRYILQQHVYQVWDDSS